MERPITAEVNHYIERISLLETMVKWSEGSAIFGEAQSDRDALLILAKDAPQDIRKVIEYLIERYERLLASVKN